jgi:hypothetical protein
MADFRDELHIERCTDKFGKTSWFPWYNWCQTTTDLADGTVKIVASGMEVSLGEVCKVINDWGNASEAGVKLNIRVFLESDRFKDSCEY